ncbi:MAG: hypothetical protein IJM46_11980 [Oscillospiraceae bacterium]|nr:hypothetical protein [Oscillospiraceae bacterium]
MVSIYTDKAREKRYFVLRKKKKTYETCFGICVGIYALIMITELIGGVASRGMAIGLGVNQIARIGRYHLAANFLVLAVGLCGILFRKWIPAAIGAAGLIFLAAAGWMTPFCIGLIGLIPLCVTVWAGLGWSKLQQEEGFPRFQIDLEEYESQRKAQISFMQQRALRQGVRTAAQVLDPDAEMHDLAEQAGPDALPAMLQGYHARSAGSDPVVAVPVPHYDRMQTISEEEVGGLEEL